MCAACRTTKLKKWDWMNRNFHYIISYGIEINIEILHMGRSFVRYIMCDMCRILHMHILCWCYTFASISKFNTVQCTHSACNPIYCVSYPMHRISFEMKIVTNFDGNRNRIENYNAASNQHQLKQLYFNKDDKVFAYAIFDTIDFRIFYFFLTRHAKLFFTPIYYYYHMPWYKFHLPLKYTLEAI